MKWNKEVTIHRIEADGKVVSVDYTGVFISDGGAKVTARHAPDSAEVSFVVTHDRPDALDVPKIEQIAETIARLLESSPTSETLKGRLDRSMETFDWSVRTANCLQNANIFYVGELVQKSEADMLRLANFGRRSLAEVKEILADLRLTLGMTPGQLAGWTPPATPAT